MPFSSKELSCICNLSLLGAVNPSHYKHGALPLLLLHDCVCITIRLEQASLKDLCRRIMYDVPLVETATLAQRSHCVWEGVVHIMEEHLVPAVTAAQYVGHDRVQDGPAAMGVVLQELVPRVGVREAGDEEPGGSIAAACGARDAEHEL